MVRGRRRALPALGAEAVIPGHAAMAQEHSNKAKMFSMIATITGTVWSVIS